MPACPTPSAPERTGLLTGTSNLTEILFRSKAKSKAQMALAANERACSSFGGQIRFNIRTGQCIFSLLSSIECRSGTPSSVACMSLANRADSRGSNVSAHPSKLLKAIEQNVLSM